jgi:hypothetical protein
MDLTEKRGEIIKHLQLAYFGSWQTKLRPCLAAPGCAIVFRADRPFAVACNDRHWGACRIEQAHVRQEAARLIMLLGAATAWPESGWRRCRSARCIVT